MPDVQRCGAVSSDVGNAAWRRCRPVKCLRAAGVVAGKERCVGTEVMAADTSSQEHSRTVYCRPVCPGYVGPARRPGAAAARATALAAEADAVGRSRHDRAVAP